VSKLTEGDGFGEILSNLFKRSTWKGAGDAASERQLAVLRLLFGPGISGANGIDGPPTPGGNPTSSSALPTADALQRIGLFVGQNQSLSVQRDMLSTQRDLLRSSNTQAGLSRDILYAIQYNW